MSDQDRPSGRPAEGQRPKIHITDKRGQGAGQGGGQGNGGSETPPAPETLEEQPQAVEGKPDNEELQKLADDRLDQLMRMKADFENFRKREMREKTELIERASLRVVERIIPVLDDFQRAIEAIKQADETGALARGVELVEKHLHDVLVEEGLEKVEQAGAFDPAHHEAVSTIPGDVSEPTVLEVVRPGYQLKGKTIRPALVHVTVPHPTEGTE